MLAAAVAMSVASGCGVSGSELDPSSAGFSDSCAYWSVDSRWVAFDRGRGGISTIDSRSRVVELDTDVYVASADGRRLLRLTQTRAEDEVLGWLEQPPRVVYRSRDGLFTVAPRAGARPQRLGSLRPDDLVAALSHDGRRAFVIAGAGSVPGSDILANPPSTYALVEVGLRRNSRHELDRAGPVYGDAAWSPDDASLAYGRDRYAYPMSELVVVRGGRVVLRERLQALDGLGWSPDGGRLAFGGLLPGSGDQSAQIWVLQPDGGGARQLTHRDTVENTEPFWAPDGRRIYYESGGGLRSITPAGTNDTRITNGQTVCPAISPDGTRIAYTRTESAGYFVLEYSQLMLMRSDGSDRRPATTGARP